jgi:hypothetical protein
MIVIALGSASVTITRAEQTKPPTDVGSTAPPGTVPVGKELDVRLQSRLNSGTSKNEQRFEATTVADAMQGDKVLIPAGSVVRGVVSDVTAAGRVDRTGSMKLTFDGITINNQPHQIRAMATQVFQSGGLRDDKGTATTGASIGGVIGGLAGGVSGALLGAAIGAGGAVASTEGKDIDLPAGTVIRIRFDSPLDLGGAQ